MQLDSEEIIRAIDERIRGVDRAKERALGNVTNEMYVCLKYKRSGLIDARKIVLGLAEQQVDEMAQFYAEDGYVEEE